MAISINSADDLKIYENENHFKVFAGPGAGKTHLLVENIKNIINNSKKLSFSGRKILCITYTNAAADEIVNRLGNYNEFVYVSTIHSFVYDQIIKESQQQLRVVIKEKFNMELDSSTRIMPRQEGFRLLSKEDEEQIRQFTTEKSGLDIGPSSRIKIEECIVDISYINKFPFNKDATVKLNPSSFSEELAYWIKYGMWTMVQKIDFDEILYFGYELVKRYKHIVYNLQYRFPYVLIDEYQDTNPLQNALLKAFADSSKCILGVIGDIAQSIYGFQNADYREFKDFSVTTKTIDEYVVNGNRRSTQNIIHFINYLRKADNILSIQTCEKNKANNSKVKFVIGQSGSNVIASLPTDIVVLCRRWADVFQYIPDLSSEQQRLINTIQNHYTYTFHRDFFTEIEQERIDWIKISAYVVKVKNALQRKCMASAIDISRKLFNVDSFIIKGDSQALNFKKFFNFIRHFSNIPSDMIFSEILDRINQWLTECELIPIEPIKVASSDADEYYDKRLYDNVNKLEYITLEKMILDVFTKTGNFMTIHRAKGREFENVLVNIKPARDESRVLRVNDVLCNPVVFLDNCDNDSKVIGEYTRLVYVGASRAINNLYLYVDANDIDVNKFRQALQDFMTSNNIAESFYEFLDI